MADSKPSLGLSDATRRFLSCERCMLIDGAWVAALSGETLEALNPANGSVLTRVPAAGPQDVDRAVRAARSAFEGEWSSVRPVTRERLLLRLADLIEANAQELAELEALDNGKSVVMARHGDVAMAVDFVRYMAGWATKIEGSTIAPSVPYMPNARFSAYTLKEPVGVVGAIIPWNFPLLMAVWKVAPALAAGCTMVLKPAEETSLSALRLGELVLEAGYPAGVLNVVTGWGHAAGAALASHPGVDKVAFTGSTEVGKLVGKAAMDNMARVSLELGGKSPVIVLEDADPATAATGAAQAIFFNHGQVCTAGSRLFVHRSRFDAVLAAVADIANGMKLGSGFDPEAQMGPLVSAKQRERVCRYITAGQEDGARILAGGGPVNGPGYFVKPTVLVDTRPDMSVVREEIFGPVLVAMAYDDLDEVAQAANDSSFGLGASIWSNDLRRVQRLIPKIKAGTVWVNCHNILDPAVPFGGFKQSGIGREMGRAVFDLYTETKSVVVAV